MLFKIEGRVCFRIDDGALWEQNDEGEKVILSPIVSRLLYLFIQEKGRVLTREEIMSFVWEKHGLEPSNNSLNQYVSQLRKLMSRFHLPDDAIRTVPREGFVLKHDLDINVENESEHVTSYLLSTETSHLLQKSKQTNITWLTISLIILLISTPFLVIYYTDIMDKQYMTVTPEKIGEIGNCPIYFVLMGRNSKLNEALSTAHSFIEQNKISCNDESQVYFFSTGSALKNQGGRVFLSHCQKKDNEILSCMDYSYHSWM